MSTTTRPITAEDLLRMPHDGFRYELLRGELRKTVPAGYDHGRIAGRIGARLGVYAMNRELGVVCAAETGFVLESDPDHVRAPDVSFVSSERAKAAGSTPGFFPGPPDVAVEVISPADRYPDVEEKVADWLAAGTLAVIVVDPRRRTVRVHRPGTDVATLAEDDTLTVEEAVPGWQMPVAEIFS